MSQRFNRPSSWPVTMNLSSAVHAATVVFFPVGLIVKMGSSGSAVEEWSEGTRRREERVRGQIRRRGTHVLNRPG